MIALLFVQNMSVIVINLHFCLCFLLSNRDHNLVEKNVLKQNNTTNPFFFIYTHIYIRDKTCAYSTRTGFNYLGGGGFAPKLPCPPE